MRKKAAAIPAFLRVGGADGTGGGVGSSALPRARFRLAFCAVLAAASRMTALNLSAATASTCAHAVVPAASVIAASLERWARTRIQLL